MATTTTTTRKTTTRKPDLGPRAWWDPAYYADPRNATAARSILNPWSGGDIMGEAAYHRQLVTGMASLYTPNTERALLAALSGSPNISPGTAASLAIVADRFGIPQEVQDEILTLDATEQARDPALVANRKPEQGSEGEKGGFAAILGEFTRPVFSLASMPFELVIGSMRSLVNDITQRDDPGYVRESPGEELGEIFSQTLGGQYLKGVFTEESADMGEGYVPRGDVAARQIAAARSAAPLVHGHAWTLGRGVGSVIFDDPESLAYRNLSGFIDLMANLVLDPLVLVAKPAAAARSVTAGVRTAAAAELGRKMVTAEIEQLAGRAEVYAATAAVVSRATMTTVNDYVRGVGLDYARAQDTATGVMNAERAHLDARMDELLDKEDAARGNAANPREAEPAEDAIMIDEVAILGDEGLDALTADVVSKAPELPGTFTDALPTAGTPRVLPGSDNGMDAVVRYTGPEEPNIRSVDDQLDDPAALAATVSEGLGRSADRTRGISALTTAINRPGATYGDILTVAENHRVGGPLLNALRESPIDAITDVFRLTGSQNGVWWTGRDATVLRNTGDGWRQVDNSIDGAAERLDAVAAQKAELGEAIKAANRKHGTIKAAQTRMANRYAQVWEQRTSVDDSWEAMRNAIEFGVGIRRGIDGNPQTSYELVREFLTDPRSFDAAVDAHAKVPADLRAAQKVDRAFTGLVTLGASEVIRAAGRKIRDPFMTNLRRKVLDEMVRLGDTPVNLGRLQRLTGGKIDPALLRGVLQATDEEGVLSTLGPALGVGISRPLDAGVLTAARMRVSGLNSGRAVDSVFAKGQRWMLDNYEQLTSIAPRVAQHLNLADPQGSAHVLRNYLTNLPAGAHNLDATDRLIGEYLTAGTEVGRARVVRRAMDQVAEDLAGWTRSKHGLSEQTASLLADSIKAASRIYDSGRADVANWWLKKYQHDSSIGYMTTDGELIHLVGPQLEAELARGGMILPEMRALRDAAGRWGQALEHVPGLKASRDLADRGLDYWRSAVLFRYAYTVRNIGEMQFRMFLTGHRNFFSHPIAALAMASALNKNTPVQRRFAATLAKYNKLADGTTLPAVGDDAMDALDEVYAGYVEAMSRSSSAHDMRTYRAMSAQHDLREVRVDQPGFVRGWAEQLMDLHSSRLVRLVAGHDPAEITEALARGAAREDLIVDWVLNSPGAAGMRREFTEAGPDYARIFTDPVAMRDYLFDSPASIKARVWEATVGGDEELLEFLVTGTLRRGDEDLFTTSSRGLTPQERAELADRKGGLLAKHLDPYLAKAPEDLKLQMRVFTGGVDDPKGIDKVIDTWFAWNGRKEAAWSMGPEFSYAFNDEMVRLMPAVDADTRAKIHTFVHEAEGRWTPHSEILTAADASMKLAPGYLNMDDATKVAGRAATEHVKKLFYDARQRNQFFHQMRFVWPFAQPFVNTLSTWGRLLAARPYMMEKIGRLAIGLSEPGSGVIYDDFDALDPFTDRQSRDPTQGFIWADPETGEEMFSYPLIGSILGALSPGFEGAAAQQLVAPVSSLNLAFQGDIDYLPGLGPMISIPTAILLPDDWYGAAPEWFRRWAFPFGEPNLESGLIESTTLPGWARRLTGALGNKEFRAYSWRGLLPYFVSTREYPNLVGDPGQQQQLIEDVNAASGWVTFIRAVAAAFLPAAPTQEIYAADSDGRMIGTAYLAHHFQQLRDEADGDYEAATKAFIQTYGEQALAAIVPTTEGEPSISGPGWEFYKSHPDQAAGYTDVLGDFFPGDFSYEANQFLLETQARQRLSVAARTDKMVSFLYSARKAALDGRAVREDWDTDMIEQAQDELRTSFGGVIPTFAGVDSRTKLDKIRRAIELFPALADTRGGQGATLLFEAHERYTEEAERIYGTGLAGAKAAPVREEFLDELDSIVAAYGGDNLPEGSVENIALYFKRIVEPRG